MESDKIRLEIASPYRQVLNVEVDEVIAPGEEGQFGVLPGHTPFLATISVGQLMYRQGNQMKYVAVSHGYAEVEYHRVIVLLDAAELPHEIDLDRAEKARLRAEGRLAELVHEDRDYYEELAALDRAMNRISIAKI
ncbi:MAG: F0F1 ATP synthase subunit epsilon [Deltaproteobacteria bacterium]|nr:MAG: F0F1 ATP synthase subunit epsilon [Deltaproteobacteria bacterium]